MRLARPVAFGGLAALLVAAALAIAVLEFAASPARAVGEAMAVDCNASSPAIDTACSYDPGATFQIAVHATNAGSGYAGYQAKLRWLDATLEYFPAADPATENQWPVSCFAARTDNQPGDPSVLYGCASFPVVVSSLTGALVQLEMQCQALGTTALTLVPRPGDSQGGTQFVDNVGSTIDAALTNASVTCGTPPATATQTAAPTNTPTNTPGATATPTQTTQPGTTSTPANTPTATPTLASNETPTATPTTSSDTPTATPTLAPPTATPTLAPPTATPTQTRTPEPVKGDVNNDGRTNSIDAALVLQFDAGLVHSLPNPVNADVNHNGAVNSVDAALILQIDAGLFRL
jgi:hypothetical protein